MESDLFCSVISVQRIVLGMNFYVLLKKYFHSRKARKVALWVLVDASETGDRLVLQLTCVILLLSVSADKTSKAHGQKSPKR